MKVGTLSDGGFYGRQICLPGVAMHYSAWFREDGSMTDAQGWDRLRRSRPVRKDSPVWRALEALAATIGKRAKEAPDDPE